MNDEQNLLVLGVVWFVVNSLIGYGLGSLRSQQGRGVIAAVVLGPLGWLCILGMADQRGRCRECRGLVRNGARVCRHCGRDLIITRAG